ncbi:MAG TPA: sulfite exporter TauE/SafE family protein [Solirubrobacteraceae bacterium]|nr:sulfite exporter TauE/SafE family protein [Solirubrobacteraceae bacterium]
MDPTVILFGFGVGLLIGITGMGGGSLMTPLLILMIGTKPIVAVGTDLAYGAVTKTLGGWRHFTKGTVFPRLAFWLAVGSCPAALVGVWVLDRLRESIGDDFDSFMMVAIGGVLLLTGGLVLLRALAIADQSARERGAFRMQTRHKVAAVSLGASVGFVLGITSAGSGTLIGIGLILGFRLSPHRVVGTDVAHAAVLLWVAAFAHVVAGNVDYGLAGTILIGSLPGVWIGTNFATRLPKNALRAALGVVLLTSGLALLSKAGLELPAFVLVAVPVVGAVGCYLILRRRAPDARLVENAR